MLSDPASTPVITHIEGFDEMGFSCRIWKGKPGHCVVIYLHGLVGHSLWFQETANKLNQRGIGVYAPDRRGSGANLSNRGDLISYRTLLSDLEQLISKASSENPTSPIVIMGNCWGAKLAAIVAAQNYKPISQGFLPELSGLILTCPAIVTKIDFDWLTKVKIAYGALSNNRLARQQFPIPIDAEMLTDNPAYIDFINNDRLRITEATSRFYFESFKLSLMAYQAAKQITLPLLLIAAGKDQIVDNDRLKQWYTKCRSNQKQWHLFPEVAHSFEFDPLYFTKYLDLLCSWLLSQTTVAAK